MFNPYKFRSHETIRLSKNAELTIPNNYINDSMFWMKYLGDYYDSTGGESIRIRLPYKKLQEYGLLKNSRATSFLFILSHITDKEIEENSIERSKLALDVLSFGVYRQHPGTNFYHAYVDKYDIRWYLVRNEPNDSQFDVFGRCGKNTAIESNCLFNLVIEEQNLLIEFSLAVSELSDYDSIAKYLETLIESWKTERRWMAP